MKLRILLVDDHSMLRTGIRALVDSSDCCEVVGEAADGNEALRLAESLEPDVIIMDIAMPEMNGFDALRQLSARRSKARVIVLSAHGEREYVVEALRAGAAGYLVKDSAFEDLAAAVEAVMKGQRYLGKGASAAALDGFLAEAEQGARAPADGVLELEKLSPREREVLRLIAESRTSEEIGALLCISKHTVQTYRKRIMEKLGINRAIDLARFALRHGVASLD